MGTLSHELPELAIQIDFNFRPNTIGVELDSNPSYFPLIFLRQISQSLLQLMDQMLFVESLDEGL
jgi:hypothetical protein